MSPPLTEACFVAQAMALADTALFQNAERIRWSLASWTAHSAHWWSDDLRAALQKRCDHARQRTLHKR